METTFKTGDIVVLAHDVTKYGEAFRAGTRARVVEESGRRPGHYDVIGINADDEPVLDARGAAVTYLEGLAPSDMRFA